MRDTSTEALVENLAKEICDSHFYPGNRATYQTLQNHIITSFVRLIHRERACKGDPCSRSYNYHERPHPKFCPDCGQPTANHGGLI